MPSTTAATANRTVTFSEDVAEAEAAAAAAWEEEEEERRRQQQQDDENRNSGKMSGTAADEVGGSPAAAAAATSTDVATTTTAASHAPSSPSQQHHHHHHTQQQQLICPNCGSKEIEQPHDASGASVCTDCGVVVEENAIVSAVEFVEGTGGASTMVGQFVSATSSKAFGTGSTAGGGSGGGIHHRHSGGGSRYGFSRDSRETTLANGRRRIQEVASRLRLGSHYVDAAHRLFTIAVEKNFVQGRRTTHVVAACLYIACRQEKSQHMLIDFSDALQVNVYTLGTCFLKFRRLLGLKLEIIDPALYVYRFAAHLGLEDKANAVALTALRLVGRMKRDWIVAGRRPAGICAAALLIAARAHGFGKHHQDVTRILRVCGLTVTNRIKEFEQTPSAHLTLDQFNVVDLEAESDPPVFRKNRINEARAKAIQDGNVALLSSGALDDPALNGKRATRWREQPTKPNDKKVQFQQLYSSLESELASDTEDKQQEDGKESTEDGDADDARKPPAKKRKKRNTKASTDTTDQLAVSKEKDSAAEKSGEAAVAGGAALGNVPEEWKQAYPKSKYGKALVLPDHATEEERRAPIAPTEGKLNLEEWKSDMPDWIDKEVDSFFRTEEEEKQKELIFNKLNKDYIEQQERKESERRSAEAASKNQEKEDAAQAEGHARYKSSRNKRAQKQAEGGDGAAAGTGAAASTKASATSEPSTTEEQLLAAVNSRKISRKINYDALSSIFDEDGSFSTEVAEDQEGEGESEDPMYEMI